MHIQSAIILDFLSRYFVNIVLNKYPVIKLDDGNIKIDFMVQMMISKGRITPPTVWNIVKKIKHCLVIFFFIPVNA